MTAQERPWHLDPARAPKVHETDTVIFSEHGRIAFNLDYRSHWFILVKQQFAGHALLVSHGAGEEQIQLPRCRFEHVIDVLSGLNSDLRYLMMYQLFDIHKEGRTLGREAVEFLYKKAFAHGRLKKRKIRGANKVKIWIEPEITRADGMARPSL